MKKSLSIAAIFVVALCLQTVYSQTSITGTVVDVIDGRTLVLQTAGGKRMNVRLRYIEVPEPEQPLAAVVRDHLRKLTLGKTVSFVRVGLSAINLIGVGTLEEKTVRTDLSRQLLRDGAGWFDTEDSDASIGAIADDYKQTEAAARTEKRGVWGVPAMKTASEFRREKAAAAAAAQPAPSAPVAVEADKNDYIKAAKKVSPANAGRPLIYDFDFGTPAKPNAENAAAKSAAGDANRPLSSNISQVYFAQFNKGTISTKPYEFEVKDGARRQKVSAMFLYSYSLENGAKQITEVSMMVITDFVTKPFLEGKNVGLLLADGSKVGFGTPEYHKTRRSESIVFKDIEKQALLSILQNDSATLLIGKSKVALNAEQKNILDEFIGTLR